jgi:hypothetical protein
MTQAALILQYLSTGHTLTPLESLSLFGCMALSQRIGELKRQGFPIKSTLVEVPSHKHVARYEWDWESEKIAW